MRFFKDQGEMLAPLKSMAKIPLIAVKARFHPRYEGPNPANCSEQLLMDAEERTFPMKIEPGGQKTKLGQDLKIWPNGFQGELRMLSPPPKITSAPLRLRPTFSRCN